MDDLIKELRNPPHHDFADPAPLGLDEEKVRELMARAADEIERLREAVRMSTSYPSFADIKKMIKQSNADA